MTETKKTILIIEDEEDLVELLTMSFEKEGFKIIKAYDGNDGYKKATTLNPDIIILDVMLPGMNGYDVCSKLKGDENYKNIPILMYTALMEDLKGYDAGADAFVIKPLGSPDDLLFKIRELLFIKEEQSMKLETDQLEQVNNQYIYTRVIKATLPQVKKKLETTIKKYEVDLITVVDIGERLKKNNTPIASQCLVYEVCEPKIAKEVLGIDMSVSSMLPCRIAIYEDFDRIILCTMRPKEIMGLFHIAGLREKVSKIEDLLIKIINDV